MPPRQGLGPRETVGLPVIPTIQPHLPLDRDHRQIIGYIERDGTVTNTSRQPVAEIELD